MTDLSPSLQTQNPNSTQDEQSQNPSQPQSPQTQTLEIPDPQTQTLENPVQSELDQIQNQLEEEEEEEEKAADPQALDLKGGQQNHQEPDNEQLGMSSSLSPPLSVIPPLTDPHDPHPPPITSPSNSNVSRRPNKRKKGGRKKHPAIEKKLQTLTQNLKPIPFIPSKTLDFDKHQKLFKRLGLWDFVHAQFDPALRVDLIAQLIANYDPKSRCSYVNESRVMVNRADLARAFKLPVKKEKGDVDLDSEGVLFSDEETIGFIEEFVSNYVLLHEDTWMMPNEVLNWTRSIKDGHPEKVDWAGLIWFMVEKELMQGKVLEDCYYASHLQYLMRSQKEEMFKEEPPKFEAEAEAEVVVEAKGEEDSGEVKMMGQEEPNVEAELEVNKEEDDGRGVKMEKENMEEIEAAAAVDAKDEEEDGGDVKMMGQEEPNVEAELEMNKEEDDGHEVKMEKKNMEEIEEAAVAADAEAKEEEEDGGEVKMGDFDEDGGEVAKMGEFDDFMGQELEDNALVGEEPNVELTLGKEMIVEEEEEEEEVKDGGDMMDVVESEVEEQGQWLLNGKNVAGDHFLQRCNIVGDSARDGGNEERKLIEEVVDEEDEEEEEEPEDDGFNLMPKGNSLEGVELTGNLLQGMETTQMPFSLPGHLRDQPELLSPRNSDGGPSVFGNSGKREISHLHDGSLNGNNKRLRIDGSWSHKSSDFDMCMEEVQHWMEKARMMYQTKEQACEESNMNQQYLLGELQRRDNVIEHLHKGRREELQKKDGEIYRLERELYVMGNLLEGYRKALKETHKAFSEYRQRCQLPEEPLYKDAGPGGLMLSTMELEKQRLKQEEEDRLNRIVIEQQVKELEEEFVGKLEASLNEVHRLDKRLMDFENEVKLMKELSAKPKVSETSESAPVE